MTKVDEQHKNLSGKRIERVAEYNNIPIGVCNFYKREFEDYFTMENLIEAFNVASSTGRWKDSVIRYMDNWLVRMASLQTDIYNGDYTMGQLSIFPVVKRGKRRDIRAVSFEDRIVDHVICDNFLTAELTRSFIAENGACIKGRGVNYSMDVLRNDMAHMYKKHGLNYYVLSMDIKSFFSTIDHKYLKSVVKRHVKNPYTREYIYNTIDIFDGDVGIGLGSQITQLLALLDLNDMDHFIKEKLRIKHYDRYMDDFYILHESKEYLEFCLNKIKLFLANIGLNLHPTKTKLFKVNSQPITFLGFKYYHTNTGRVMCEVKKDTVKRAKRKLKKLAGKYHRGELPLSAGLQCYSAYKGHIMKGNVKSPLKGLDEYFTEQFGVSPRVKIIRHYKWKKVQDNYSGEWRWRRCMYITKRYKGLYS